MFSVRKWLLLKAKAKHNVNKGTESFHCPFYSIYENSIVNNLTKPSSIDQRLDKKFNNYKAHISNKARYDLLNILNLLKYKRQKYGKVNKLS